MGLRIVPSILKGRHISLEPLTEDLRGDMATALDCDPAGWSQMTSAGYGAHFNDWWIGCLDQIASGGRVAYAIRTADVGRVVGTTSFMSFRSHYRGVLVGGTFVNVSARGGVINAEAKLLILAEAFRAGALRVEFWVAGTNAQSQAALSRLGIAREGVLRRHWIGWQGEIHDTVVYSVTDQDWPSVRSLLVKKVYSKLS